MTKVTDEMVERYMMEAHREASLRHGFVMFDNNQRGVTRAGLEAALSTPEEPEAIRVTLAMDVAGVREAKRLSEENRSAMRRGIPVETYSIEASDVALIFKAMWKERGVCGAPLMGREEGPIRIIRTHRRVNDPL